MQKETIELEFPLAGIVLREKNIRAEYTKMAELGASISAEGIIEPLVVERLLNPDKTPNGKAELIAGYRRYFAAKKLGLATVPVRFVNADESRKHRLAMIENIQREDMNPMDVAVGIRQMMDNEQLDQKNVAESLGVSEGYVSQHLSLLKLPPKAQSAVKTGKIEMTHARALGRLKNPDAVLGLLKEASTITASELNDKVEFVLQKEREKEEKTAAKPAADRPEPVKEKPATSSPRQAEAPAPREKKSLAERYAEMELAPLNDKSLREQMMSLAIKLDRAESEAKRTEYKYTLKGLEIAAGVK
jgi:ParB family chromosome partitioning protein